ERRPRARRHARVEDGEEHEPVRERGHPQGPRESRGRGRGARARARGGGVMAAFDREALTVNGVEVTVQTAGAGEPLVFFHGAGTVTGFDALLPIAERFRLIVPYHPGYGPSADDPSVDSIWDYVRHHLNLLDLLGIDTFCLAGTSMGGYMAALFAATQAARVRRLALCCPIGLRVSEH